MSSRFAIAGWLMLLALSLPGCGNQAPGQPRSSLGGGDVAILACIGFFVLFVLATVIGGVVLMLRSKKATAKAASGTEPGSAPRIFVSYRRSDSQDVAGRIYDTLVARFAKDSVFKDVDSIPLGKDFRKVLQKAVKRAEVVIVIIGPRWTNAKTAAGAKRLDDVNDFVRIEIETALAEGIPIIPVMVSNARMVAVNDLPKSLQQLTFHNGLPVRPDPDFHRDMERLVAALEKMFPGSEKATVATEEGPKGRGVGFWLGGCALTAVVIVGILLVLGVVLASVVAYLKA